MKSYIDMTDERCETCAQGTYIERQYFDDMDSLLRCSNCNECIDRYKYLSEDFQRGFLSGVDKALEMIQTEEEQGNSLRKILVQKLMDLRTTDNRKIVKMES